MFHWIIYCSTLLVLGATGYVFFHNLFFSFSNISQNRTCPGTVAAVHSANFIFYFHPTSLEPISFPSLLARHRYKVSFSVSIYWDHCDYLNPVVTMETLLLFFRIREAKWMNLNKYNQSVYHLNLFTNAEKITVVTSSIKRSLALDFIRVVTVSHKPELAPHASYLQTPIFKKPNAVPAAEVRPLVAHRLRLENELWSVLTVLEYVYLFYQLP